MKIKTSITAVVLFIIGTNISRAQLPGPPMEGNNIPRQSVYVELGGNAMLYSLNYDVVFSNNWGFRLGGSYYPGSSHGDDFLFNSSVGTDAFLGLIMGLHLFGKVPNQIETGAGILFGTIYEPQKWDAPKPPGLTFTLGYRYYPKEFSHVTFKAAFTPIINSSGIHPYFGISLGITLTPQGDARLFH